MSWVGWVAAAFGLLTLLVVALMMPPRNRKSAQDPTMKYESMVAVGFGMLLFAGPLWLLQLGFTIAAAISGGSGLLWLWLFVAPIAGSLPPVRMLLHALVRRRRPAST